MDRLTAIQVFVDVARSGSFTATADRLDMSRAMVTRHIATMERWLNARLLQRTTRQVTLTQAGEQALHHCRQMLLLASQAETETAPTGGQLRGQLRLTASMSFAHAHLAAAIGDFLALHPALKIDLNAGDATLNLVESRVDLAIRISREPDPALIARPLASCASVLVASPDYLAAHGMPEHPQALVGHRCLGHSRFNRDEWTLQQGDTFISVEVATHFTANEATILLEAARAGGGISLQPRYLAWPLLTDGQLVEVLPQWQAEQMTIYALYPSRQHLPPAVRALLDFLVERFAAAHW